jgi:hypothetical protein
MATFGPSRPPRLHWCIFERQSKGTMNWKPQDWVEHASFGLGCVNENRGDRLDIDFINSGSKTILRTTELKAALPPPDFNSVHLKSKSRSPRVRVVVRSEEGSRNGQAKPAS